MKYLRKFGQLNETDIPVFKSVDEFSGNYQVIWKNEFKEFNKTHKKVGITKEDVKYIEKIHQNLGIELSNSKDFFSGSRLTTFGNTIELYYEMYHPEETILIMFKMNIIKYENDIFFVTPYSLIENSKEYQKANPYSHLSSSMADEDNSYICDDNEGVGSLLKLLLTKNSPLWVKSYNIVKYGMGITVTLDSKFSYL